MTIEGWTAIQTIATVVYVIETGLIAWIALQVPKIAHDLSGRQSRAQTAMNAFIKLNLDLQEYRDALVGFAARPVKFVDVGGGAVFGCGYEGEEERLWRLKNAIANLNADCLALGLIFDKRADTLGKAIHSFIEEAPVMRNAANQRKEELVITEDRLNKRVVEISLLIRPLWESVR